MFFPVFFKGVICLFLKVLYHYHEKGFYIQILLFRCDGLFRMLAFLFFPVFLRELLMSFLKSSIIIMRSDFRSKSCFSSGMVYPGFAMVGELCFDVDAR